MRLSDIYTYDEIYMDGKSKSGCNTSENSVPGLPNLEAQLKVRHADLITSLEKKVNDYPEHACCNCECLLQRKDVTSLKNSDTKFKSGLWQHVKNHASKHNPEVCFNTL